MTDVIEPVRPSVDALAHRPRNTPSDPATPTEPGGNDMDPRAAFNRRLEALVADVSDGDEGAFAELYDATNARMYGVILRTLRAVDHAHEVAQELYLEVWRQASRYQRARGSVITWMTVMAHRRAVDRVRSVNSDTARDDRYARETAPRAFDLVWSQVEQTIDQRKIHRALGVLTPVQREAIALTYLGGHTQQQTAEILQIPLGTVKTRVRDGLARLREVLPAPE
ncbi:RNA polymerase sigma-70 factor (ECF subfamily) [Friedmanniella endophytica]|uniref:RNA polymerase sigma-70 factor (ECF subfamily) n=1 Tax=Microlunatus kandeliicorticis TaxID=1759536 RepID=A0A7W3INT3_9ACTN|nr:sigma-70 family RNA polymerase sigma factor [Microlunatus kandeliicorticis]MBA8792490.1 RNA polymerase sigma-70 factor (ECF subfamily) [Microlunatus kandeliicorticis]